MSDLNQYQLGEYVQLSNEKIEARKVPLDRYISTDNLIPNLGGIERAKGLPNQSKYIYFKKGDILFSNIRTYFKKVWQAEFDGGCSNDVLVFKPKDNQTLDKGFLYYILSNQRFIDYTAFTAKGTKMPRGDKDAIKKYKILLPDLVVQKEITKTLSNLDKKINYLREQNQTLEELAQTLFKRWFVDFEFPDENEKPYKSSGGKMVESELGDIPEGWRVGRLKEICEVLNGRAYKNSEFKESGIPIIRIQNVNGGSNYVYSDLELPEDKYVEHGDLIFAWSATFGAFLWRGEKSIYHYHIWKLKCFDESSKLFLYQYLLRITNSVTNQGTGSIFSHITKGLMEEQELIVPPKEILDYYDKTFKSLDTKISNNSKEILSLTQLRDTLLPKLMSGQIKIKV